MTKRDWDSIEQDILDRLDIAAEFQILGVTLASDQPNKKGWVPVHCQDAEDNNPSAGINVGDGSWRGWYNCFKTGRKAILFNFAVQEGAYLSLREAREAYASKAGVSLEGLKNTRSSKDSLVLSDWNESVAKVWCQEHRKGLTADAFRRAGGELGKYTFYDSKAKKRVSAFVATLPVYGSDPFGGPPVGHVMWLRNGGQFPTKSGKPIKMKTREGSSPGWMGEEGLKNLAEARYVWKLEGPTDVVALMGLIPESDRKDHAVITNSNGCMENPRDEFLECLSGKTVYVLHDADEPGQVGAEKWTKQIARWARETRHVRLPYEIKAKHGEDVRDFINSGATWEDFLDLAQLGDIIGLEAPEHIPPEDEVPIDHREAEVICDAIGLEVQGQRVSDGKTICFSRHYRKRVELSADLKRVGKLTLIQACGSPAREAINETDEFIPGKYTLKQILEAIAIISGYHPISEDSLSGRGVWKGKTIEGDDSQTIVIVGSKEAARLNGEAKLTRITSSRVDGLILDIGNSDPWYDFNSLNGYIQKAHDPEWCADTIEEIVSILGQWNWGCPEYDPWTVAGLIMATWVQTVWKWRPMVAISGASKAGKSSLFQFLAGERSEQGLFGNLAIPSSKSTEAGIRQALGNQAAILLCDEFESDRHRQAILDLLRTASTGSEVLKGTADQRGKRFGLQHICWVAAIETGLNDQADRNRFINFELKPATAEQYGHLNLMPESDRLNLGQKLLAIAVAHCREAARKAVALKQVSIEGVDTRIVECYAVPAAIIGQCRGWGLESMATLLSGMTQNQIEEDHEADEGNLLTYLLNRLIRCEREEHPVARVIGFAQADMSSPVGGQYMAYLENHGLAIREVEGENCLFIACRVVRQNLLGNSEWSSTGIAQLLARLPGAIKTRARVNGQKLRGVAIPMSSFSFAQEPEEAAWEVSF